jgi:hypothetical protein
MQKKKLQRLHLLHIMIAAALHQVYQRHLIQMEAGLLLY